MGTNCLLLKSIKQMSSTNFNCLQFTLRDRSFHYIMEDNNIKIMTEARSIVNHNQWQLSAFPQLPQYPLSTNWRRQRTGSGRGTNENLPLAAPWRPHWHWWPDWLAEDICHRSISSVCRAAWCRHGPALVKTDRGRLQLRVLGLLLFFRNQSGSESTGVQSEKGQRRSLTPGPLGPSDTQSSSQSRSDQDGAGIWCLRCSTRRQH